MLLLALLAGAGAGFLNTVVGSGSLLSFPVLVACGLSPVSANITSNLGLVFGGLTGTWGYRAQIPRTRAVAGIAALAAVGGLLGAFLLLAWPDLFGLVVPVLVALAALLVVLRPWLRPTGDRAPVLLAAGVLLTAVYGGYFGAAQGVLLLGVLGAVLPWDLQVLNATKNLCQVTVNVVAAVVFAVVAPEQIDLALAAAVAVGAGMGGLLGARVGKQIPDRVLRAVVVAIAVVAIGFLVT